MTGSVPYCSAIVLMEGSWFLCVSRSASVTPASNSMSHTVEMESREGSTCSFWSTKEWGLETLSLVAMSVGDRVIRRTLETRMAMTKKEPMKRRGLFMLVGGCHSSTRQNSQELSKSPVSGCCNLARHVGKQRSLGVCISRYRMNFA